MQNIHMMRIKFLYANSIVLPKKKKSYSKLKNFIVVQYKILSTLTICIIKERELLVNKIKTKNKS